MLIISSYIVEFLKHKYILELLEVDFFLGLEIIKIMKMAE